MDPLVLLFLSKTDKVEEFLENNFTSTLEEMGEFDELGLSGLCSSNADDSHVQSMDLLGSMDLLNNNNPLLDGKGSSVQSNSCSSLTPSLTSEHTNSSNGCMGNGISDAELAYPSYGRLEDSSPEVSSSEPVHLHHLDHATNGQYSFGAIHSQVKSFDVKNSPHKQSLNDDFWDLDISGSSFATSDCKEEMSPSSMDCSMDGKKKKGPAPRQQEELCLVCGDRASGYHYNALTCEGCKGFFRRSITKNAVYQCKYGNSCEIDMYMRRKCQECRLKKCLQMGMRPECVVPEYQCAIKRENKRAQKELTKPNSTTKDQMLSSLPTITTIQSPEPLFSHSQPTRLNKHQEEMIKKLVFFQEEFESPSDDEVKKITPFKLGESEEDGHKRFKHVTEMTILTVQLIVEFSKRVPGFDTLLREDQITLLKACSSEVMMLRCSRKYDIKTDSIVYANNQPYTRENYKSASIGDSADALFNFCKTMCVLKVDNAEYALLTAIVIFSERPALLEPKKVEKIQEFYIDLLKGYVDNNRKPGKCYFAKLLAILTELRTLGNINSEMCVSLKVKNKKLPPFLVEIWDIDPVQEQ